MFNHRNRIRTRMPRRFFNVLKRQVKSLPFLRPLAKFISRAQHGPSKIQVFSIGIFTGPDPCSLAPRPDVRNPVLSAAHVTDLEAEFVADPFLLRRDDQWSLFFEVMPTYVRGRPQNGVIALATSSDSGSTWEYCQVVLEEPFHLSYPHVFEAEDQIYMLPEARMSGGVRLYRAVDFPLKWEFVAELLNHEFTDATPFLHQGTWWMLLAESGEQDLAGQGPVVNSVLRMYFADELTGPWVEHPMSPIVSGDPRVARPAGRVIRTEEGRLLRFAQDCRVHYGAAVVAIEITTLTRTLYEEKLMSTNPILAGSGDGWNAGGMHHVDAQHVKDAWFAFVDGWYYRTSTK